MSATPLFLVCIAGPTGAGKSAASLALAAQWAASVINADSRQIYRDFPIITAQPTAEEQRACPHLLYGFLPPEEKLGAGAYARLASNALHKTRDAGRLPLLVGGTGLYFKALLSGIAAIPQVPPHVEEQWKERCKAEGSPALHALLARRDPEYAAKIHPHDRQRIVRALSVHEATGKTFSWWHGQPLQAGPFRAVKIGVGLSLAELEPLLERRIDAMLAAGALEEAQKALTTCADPLAPGWSGIGCRELYRHLIGEISLDECRVLWLRSTRAYAKRQFTWFRADPEIRWFAPGETEEILAYVRQAKGA